MNTWKNIAAAAVIAITGSMTGMATASQHGETNYDKLPESTKASRDYVASALNDTKGSEQYGYASTSSVDGSVSATISGSAGTAAKSLYLTRTSAGAACTRPACAPTHNGNPLQASWMNSWSGGSCGNGYRHCLYKVE